MRMRTEGGEGAEEGAHSLLTMGVSSATRRQISKRTRLLGALLRASFTLALLGKMETKITSFDVSSLTYSSLNSEAAPRAAFSLISHND